MPTQRVGVGGRQVEGGLEPVVHDTPWAGAIDALGDADQQLVSRLMPKRRPEPSQSWRTFLANHIADLVSIDLFTAMGAAPPSLRRSAPPVCARTRDPCRP